MTPEELRAVFVANVKRTARRRKLTLNKLADFSGVSRGYLSDVLSEKKSPTLRTVALVADALDVEPWSLLRPARE